MFSLHIIPILALSTLISAQQSIVANTTTSTSNATIGGGTGNMASIVGNSSATSSTASSSATTTSTPLPNDGTNPLIPVSISPACQSFLEYLNADSTLSACTTPLVSTLSLFTPSSSSPSEVTNFNTSSNDISSTLATLCSGPSCSSSMIRNVLTQFSGNCTTELQEGNEAVLGLYDVLYIMTPFTAAVCAKDGDGGYCLQDIVKGSVPVAPTSSSSSIATSTSSIASNGTTTGTGTGTGTGNSTTPPPAARMLMQQALFSIQDYAGEAISPKSLYITLSSAAKRLVKRGPSSNSTISSNSTSSIASATSTSSTSGASTTASTTGPVAGVTGLLPNSTTFRTSHLPWLFLSPNMSSPLLCTSCTKSILASYISWETKIPYAVGLSNSPLLGGQSGLWNAVGTTCGTGFQSAVAVLGGQQALSGANGVRVGWVGVILVGGVVVGLLG